MKEGVLERKIDLIIDESFVKYLCECSDCQQIFSRIKHHIECIETLNEEDKKLLNNMDGNLNEDDEEVKD